jgi:hypothetical protein
MTAPREQDAWNDALTAAEQGRPAKLAALIQNGVPAFALERLAAFIIKPKSPKRTPRVEQLADAFAHWHAVQRDGVTDREATAVTCKRFYIEEGALNNVLAKNRSDVNQILRERGLLNLANSK